MGRLWIPSRSAIAKVMRKEEVKMGTVKVMIVDIDGVEYITECPGCCPAMVGMTAEIGDLRGTVTAVQEFSTTGKVYAFVKKLPVRWVRLNRLVMNCWEASNAQ